ncbi:hypothetical protein D5S19_23670 [Amycolatopsis panacis]|uniref:Uncharacterized protein n=1 Tax=Amycolatopsis panacis TaxID=2340917 RepID=A0A419HWM9_9PSEU|nr:hypothetical protein D5S19_23670 [Amycolatopsis panacis]
MIPHHGDVTILTIDCGDGTAAVVIQHEDAAEWYTLTGSPIPIPGDGLDVLHTRVTDTVREGGEA